MKKLIPILIIVLLTSISCNKSDEMLTPADQLEIDLGLIQDFIELNDLTAQSTNSGLYYVITEEGTGTESPTLDDRVSVYYKGFYLSSGAIFDQTNDGSPLTIELANTIEGWREGIPKFTKGAKGMLLIPSSLAYGPYPPTGVNANAVMVFEIELLDFFQ
jgi:FKBP-type peptidyl-prolyl cis-trans isomerase FkpA